LNLGGRTADSVAILEEALARRVDSPEIRHRLGQASWAEGLREEALDQYRTAISADGGATGARLELARALIVMERYEEALDAVQPALELTPFNQEAIAYQQLAWRFLGDARADRLCNYDRFVKARVLQPPRGSGEISSFNHRLEEVLKRLHTTTRHPLEQTLRGGTQTMGDLFQNPAPEIAAVRRMIEAAVRDYIESLPDDPDHLFLKRKAHFRFSGSWSVRLRSQGFHVNHVHSQGWISSCYYVGLPQSARGSGEQGWIKFGETGLGLGDRERVARLVRPEVGMLVLFPSYMYHGTTPFDGEDYRTTIAFDVVPA
jgi:tetratricopeptide (TPR) repeat protein